MKNFYKFIPTALMAGASFGLVACGDDSSSSSEEKVSDVFSMKGAYEIVLSKADYVFDKSDSTIKLIKPVCKEGSLENVLVGPDNDVAGWDTTVVKASLKKGEVTIKAGDDVKKYVTKDGSTFPVGYWSNHGAEDLNIQNGLRFEKNNVVKEVFHYEGSCFNKDFMAAYRDKNSAIAEAASVLTDFFDKFKSKNDTVNGVRDSVLSHTFYNDDCSEISIHDGLVTIKIDEFKASSGKLTVAYGESSCPINFSIRYAYSQSDCEDAFDEFKKDRGASKTFSFKDYWQSVDYDEYCIEQLVLDMKRENSIPLKTVAVDAKADANGFAKAVVNVITAGLR